MVDRSCIDESLVLSFASSPNLPRRPNWFLNFLKASVQDWPITKVTCKHVVVQKPEAADSGGRSADCRDTPATRRPQPRFDHSSLYNQRMLHATGYKHICIQETWTTFDVSYSELVRNGYACKKNKKPLSSFPWVSLRVDAV